VGVDSSLDDFRALVDGGAWNEMTLPLREGSSLSRSSGDSGESRVLDRRWNEINQRLSDTSIQLRNALEEERQSRSNGLQGK